MGAPMLPEAPMMVMFWRGILGGGGWGLVGGSGVSEGVFLLGWMKCLGDGR